MQCQQQQTEKKQSQDVKIAKTKNPTLQFTSILLESEKLTYEF